MRFHPPLPILVQTSEAWRATRQTQAVPAWVACEANAVECLRIIAENRGDLNSPSRVKHPIATTHAMFPSQSSMARNLSLT